MPVVSVNRDALFAALGRTYSKSPSAYSRRHLAVHKSCCALLPTQSAGTWLHPGAIYQLETAEKRQYCLLLFAAQEEFEDLCFEYGVELDDVVSPLGSLELQLLLLSRPECVEGNRLD